jgi:hypothetical protein
LHQVRMKYHMMKMKSEAMKCDIDYNQLGGEYLKAKGASDKQGMKLLKLSWNKVKYERGMYMKEYKEVKEKLGYESEECSLESSPSKDDNESE